MPFSLSAEKAWDRGATHREIYLQRAEDAASLTIPHLFPLNRNMGDISLSSGTTHETFRTPYQSVGSRGMKNVASKMVLTLLPPSHPFFRLAMDRFAFAEDFGMDALTQADQSLVAFETAIQNEMDTMGLRTAAYELFLHLGVGGNGILEVPDEGQARFWPLHTYVCSRDSSDNLMDLVLREKLGMQMLDKRVRGMLQGTGLGEDKVKQLTLYTVVERISPTKFIMRQELSKLGPIPGTLGTFRSEQMPWLVQRWNRVDGEDYGRGLAEEHIGDLRSLDGLMQSVIYLAAAAAHHIWLVSPNGRTRMRDVANAPTGAFRMGHPDDVQALRLDKLGDFQTVSPTISDLTRRLEMAFLLSTVVQRQAERVTAEEIRFMAQELQENLGGVFSLMADDFQLPLVRRVMSRMTTAGNLPDLPPDLVEPKIITGIEGLGRSQERNRLVAGLSDLVGVLGEGASELLRRREVADRLLTQAGVTTEGLLKTDEEIAQERRQEQMRQAAMELGPEVARNMANGVG